MPGFTKAREQMVEDQIFSRGIGDPRLLAAMKQVPREIFVPDHLVDQAYSDRPLPIGSDQTISQPYIVALMIEAAAIAPGDKVLEIGAGSGYAAAVMSRIADEVIAIERHHLLVDQARERMERLGYDNVILVHGDGSEGYASEAPFEAIIAAASGSHVPEALIGQLAINGCLVMPVGPPGAVQKLVRIIRTGEDSFDQDELGQVRFVPLIGARGWKD